MPMPMPEEELSAARVLWEQFNQTKDGNLRLEVAARCAKCLPVLFAEVERLQGFDALSIETQATMQRGAVRLIEENRRLLAEVERLRALNESLAERVATQSELLNRHAGREIQAPAP